MDWVDDLLALRDQRSSVPARTMLLRHWRSRAEDLRGRAAVRAARLAI
jgi:hypothetical protein